MMMVLLTCNLMWTVQVEVFAMGNTVAGANQDFLPKPKSRWSKCLVEGGPASSHFGLSTRVLGLTRREVTKAAAYEITTVAGHLLLKLVKVSDCRFISHRASEEQDVTYGQ